MLRSLVGSEMCIRDRLFPQIEQLSQYYPVAPQYGDKGEEQCQHQYLLYYVILLELGIPTVHVGWLLWQSFTTTTTTVTRYHGGLWNPYHIGLLKALPLVM
eukprot:TRINITY_DN59986_c0_g1_i1.p1 TRINITY_DN59986_c0_g1~~TRINITY_DN59986_c0_g1_i1.p1  ORF type:complete len:101 (+),score=19.68 TRINITY_DN59986_c0_g1_i1:137-439(+)